MYEITRARAFSKDVLYAAGMPADAEAQESFTRIFQYSEGSWDHADVRVSTQRIIAYRRPEGGRIAVYMSHEGVLFSPEPSFKGGRIVDESAFPGRRLGRMSDLRQVAQTLVACGDGGQNYSQASEKGWVPIDLRLFDERVDSNWVFAIKPEGRTGREQQAFWKSHPDLEAESERRLQLYTANTDLHSINGSRLDDLYMSSSHGRIFHWDGHEMKKISSPSLAYLTDILVQHEGALWICGRDGTLLHGNAGSGFAAVPGDEGPMFSKMARFQDKLYLSSYADPRGLFVYDGHDIRRVASGLRPELDDIHTVDAVEGALWAIGSRDIARFDGVSWERLPMPK